MRSLWVFLPQVFVGALPSWYYGFRIRMGYFELMSMQLIDILTFAILSGCAWMAWRESHSVAATRVFRVGLLLLIALVFCLGVVVAWGFIFVPEVPAHFPPWTTGTTLATTLAIIAPLAVLVAGISFASTLLQVLVTKRRKVLGH